MTAATEKPIVTTRALAYVLGNDEALINAKRMLEAKLRREALRKVGSTDTAINGQPYAKACFAADNEAREASEKLADAVMRAADRYVREETR